MNTKRLLSIGFLAFAVFILLGAEPAWAAEEAAQGGYLAGYENADPRPSSISWWSTAAYLASLFVIFAFVVGMAYLAARFLGGRFAKQGNAVGGRILTHLPLGPGRSVCTVRMAGRVYLLGVTEHSITLLSEVTDPQEIVRLEREADASPLAPDVFSKQFGALSGLAQKLPPLFRK
ncbi:MAG: flagellar biosynthetic protein FliO [Mitsuokella sp.]